MIYITKTESIQVSLTAAKTTNDCDVYVSVVDAMSEDGRIPSRPRSFVSKTNGTTPVIACPTPTEIPNRMVDCINIHNTDTAQKTVNVYIVSNGIPFLFASEVLQSGHTLNYTHESGFTLFT